MVSYGERLDGVQLIRRSHPRPVNRNRATTCEQSARNAYAELSTESTSHKRARQGPGKRKRAGTSSRDAHTSNKQDSQGSQGQDERDQGISTNIVTTITSAIYDIWEEEKNGTVWPRPDASRVNGIEPLAKAENISQLGADLWGLADRTEKSAADVVYMNRFLSSYCRIYLEEQPSEDDIAKQQSKKRHDDSMSILSSIINQLYQTRGSLALILYRAVCSECA